MSGDKATQNRFVFLDVLRGVAPVLVIYSHVVALFLDPNDIDTGVVDLLNEQARDPLRLEQHMGHLAVVLFFLVSGFIITQVGTQESHREFAIKRLFRVYPLLIFTVGLTAVLSIFNMEVLRTGQHFEITLQSVLTNFSLANYLMVPQIILVGVAWTLVIEIIFYLIVLSLLAVLRRWTWLAILIELTLVLSTMLLAREFGPNFFLLAINLSFLPVVLLGQVTWAVWSGRIPLWLGTLFGFACWILYVLADIRNMGRLDEAYSSTFALGFAIFIAVLLAEHRLRPNKYVSYFADRSYSLYLLHGPLAFPVMERLNGVLPLPLVILAGLALTVGATELTFRYIEQPGQRIGRKLSKRFRLKELAARKAPPEPEYEDDYDDYEDYEDYEDEPAPVGSRRIVVTGDLWDSPEDAYGPPRHHEPPNGQPHYGWPQDGERQNGAPAPLGRQNSGSQVREPRNGGSRHREPTNGEPHYGWPQEGEPQHHEPQHSGSLLHERQNGGSRHGELEDGGSLHHEPRTSRSQLREPPTSEPRHHGPQNGELQHRERRNGGSRHREPPASAPRNSEARGDGSQLRERRNSEPRHREPRHGTPPHHEPQLGEPQIGEPRTDTPPHHEPQLGESRHREPRAETPAHHEPQLGESRRREPRNGTPTQHEPRLGEPRNGESSYVAPPHREPPVREPRNGGSRHREPAGREARRPEPQYEWPQDGELPNGRPNGESRHRDPQDRQPAHREPPHRESPHRESRHGESRRESRHGEFQYGESRRESQRGEGRHGESRNGAHRQPGQQDPPPVRRSPERAHRYRDE